MQEQEMKSEKKGGFKTFAYAHSSSKRSSLFVSLFTSGVGLLCHQGNWEVWPVLIAVL